MKHYLVETKLSMEIPANSKEEAVQKGDLIRGIIDKVLKEIVEGVNKSFQENNTKSNKLIH